MKVLPCLMSPIHLKYKKEFISVLKILNENVMGFWGSKDNEKQKERYVFIFFKRFRVVKNHGEYYFRIKVKEKGKYFFKDAGPMPQNIVEEIFIPVSDFYDLKNKRSRLKRRIKMLLKDKELQGIFVDYKEVSDKKCEAVGTQDFGRAAEFRDQEKNLMDRLALAIKNQISAIRGYGWVTDDDIFDSLKSIDKI